MMIFVNGSMNSGKSTVSRILQQRLSRAALIEVDELRNFIAWMPIDESLPLNHANAAVVAKTFIAAGLDVIMPYPLSRKTFEFLVSEIGEIPGGVHAFTLNPGLEIALQNRGERILDEGERERIRYMYSRDIHNPGYGVVVDTSNLTPEETADVILEECKRLEPLNAKSR